MRLWGAPTNLGGQSGGESNLPTHYVSLPRHRATCMVIQAKHIIVHGRVQGVGFRYFVQRAGTRLGLTGNVRNCPDSTVEIVVEGSAKRIEEFLQEVKEGPPVSWVERLEIHDMPALRNYRSFLIEGW